MSVAQQHPGNWRSVKFGDLVRQVKKKVDPIAARLERYVAGEHMNTDDLRIRQWGTVGAGYLGPAFTSHFAPGHVLYGSRRTYLRKVAVADFEGVCANTTFVLESCSPELLPEFLPYVMTTERFHEHSMKQSKGSVNPYINYRDLTWYEFDLPPVEDQQQIIELLHESGNAVETILASSGALHRLINAYVTDTYQNALAEGEGTRRAADLGELTMGRQKAPKYALGVNPTPYLRVANVGHLELLTDTLELMDFSEREISRFGMKAGDVVLTEGDIVSALNVGRGAVFEGGEGPLCFQNTLIRIRPTHEVNPYFLLTMLEGARLAGVLAAAGNTTTVTHLGLRRFAEVRLPYVKPEEQAHIEQGLRALLNLRSTLRNHETNAKLMAARLREGVMRS
jgi:type I restriction enzyme S subunit